MKRLETTIFPVQMTCDKTILIGRNQIKILSAIHGRANLGWADTRTGGPKIFLWAVKFMLYLLIYLEVCWKFFSLNNKNHLD